jgi:hypothetical protein
VDPDSDPAFQVNPDTVSETDLHPIPIQGFDDQKPKEKHSRKFFKIFFDQKLHLIMSKLQEKPSALKRESPELQNMKLFSVLVLVGHPGTPLSPDPIRIRVRIHSTGILVECASQKYLGNFGRSYPVCCSNGPQIRKTLRTFMLTVSPVACTLKYLRSINFFINKYRFF